MIFNRDHFMIILIDHTIIIIIIILVLILINGGSVTVVSKNNQPIRLTLNCGSALGQGTQRPNFGFHIELNNRRLVYSSNSNNQMMMIQVSTREKQ